MIPILLITQIIVQLAWGIFCFLHSPHNLMLSGLNIGLIILTAASNATGDNEELMFQRAYLAFWIIPAFLILLSSLAGLFETQNIILEKVGVAAIQPPLEGSSTEYAHAFRNYLISMLIPPVFGIINWLISLTHRSSGTR